MLEVRKKSSFIGDGWKSCSFFSLPGNTLAQFALEAYRIIEDQDAYIESSPCKKNIYENVIIPPVDPVPLDMLVVAKLENLNVFLFIAWPSPL